MISKDELDFTLAVLPRFAGRIGEALISLGLVTGVDVFKAIREQGRDRVVATFPWRRGRYFFYRGQTAPHVEFPLDLDIPSLLLAGTESEGDGRVQTKESVTDGPLHLTFGKECTVHGLPWPPVLALAFKTAETVRTKRAFFDALMTRGPADEALAKRALAVVEAAFRVTRA
jgi:serine/threonine-protein kinase